MKKNDFILLAIIFIALGLIIIPKLIPDNGGEAYNIEIREDDHITGNVDAKTTLLVYSDFECPACAGLEKATKGVLEIHKEDMRFVYRHYPLSYHLRAKDAARASESAAAQDKFWEMHDKLFENQDSWHNLSAEDAMKTFTNYADEIGIDTEKFLTDYVSTEVGVSIEEDIESASGLDIGGTPTFFLNGKKMENLRSISDFEDRIVKEIDKNK